MPSVNPPKSQKVARQQMKEPVMPQVVEGDTPRRCRCPGDPVLAKEECTAYGDGSTKVRRVYRCMTCGRASTSTSFK